MPSLCWEPNFSFWIYPTTAGTNEFSAGAVVSQVALTAVKISFTSAQINQWQQVTIPLSSLGTADNPNFSGIGPRAHSPRAKAL